MHQPNNKHAVRNKHYSATSVTKADRQKALGIAAGEKSVGETEKSVGIVYGENAQSDPNQLVQELLKSGKGSELLEMLEKALKENDPADLEEDAKYTWADAFRTSLCSNSQKIADFLRRFADLDLAA